MTNRLFSKRLFIPLALTATLLMACGSSSQDDTASDNHSDGGQVTTDGGGTDSSVEDSSAHGEDASSDVVTDTGSGVISDAALEPDTTSEPDAGPPAIPVLPHKTDFLTAGCMTHTFAGLDAAHRKSCLAGITSRHYTHFYLYVYNEQDYGGPSFDFYAKPSEFRALLGEVRTAGLAPVVWLVPDDAPVMRSRSVAQVSAMMDKLIPQIDDLVSSYVLGLELDEYWNGEKVDSLGKHLRSLTSKKIGVHQIQGEWSYAKYAWCDYMVLQYGFGLNETQITTMTKAAIADLGKPVVAGEYAHQNSGMDNGIALGNAAVAAGATGFGNGGTP